jgi:hypothetical protein
VFFANPLKRQAASAFLLGLFLSVQAMVALPALHAWVHPKANDPDHECAVTLLSHGQVEASGATTPAFCAPTRVIETQALPEIVFVSTDVRLHPSRGPPASSVPA